MLSKDYWTLGYIGLKTEKGSHDKFQSGDIMARFRKVLCSVSRAITYDIMVWEHVPEEG